MALADRINALSAQLYPVGIPERAEQVKLESDKRTGSYERDEDIKSDESVNADITLPPAYYDIERFRSRHANADTDQDFQMVVEDYSGLCKKYDYDEYTMEMLVAAINDIERKTKARRSRSAGERR